ncbi:MAG: Prolyl oligopeptidase, partial [Bacteroidetes bacterium]|nr:Prolyl oligopeptidase [Bacteroidota bacterium]
KTLLPDSLNWLKFSGLSWRGDGFYYSRYDEPTEASKLSKKNEFHKVYYHKVGTSQDKDVLIHADSDHPLRNFQATVTEDERFVLLNASEGTSGNEIWFWDMKNPDQKTFKLLIKGFDHEPNVIDNDGDKLFVITNEGAPNYKVELIDTKNPEGPRTLIIPERKETLMHVGTGGGKLFATYLQDAANRVYQLNYAGHLEREIKLPGIGTAGGFGGKKEDKDFYYTFNSYVTPALVYKYDIASGKSTTYFTPGFSVSNLFFMEQGGIYAQVTLRGGAEYGEEWHKAGMLEKKQNVFDDFIGAAEFLIKEKYTNTSKLAVHGRSNGGLLIGAVMTQRPDLFKVAIPTVGVLDMLRYQHFTIGWAWGVEYGTSDKEDQFKYLIKYSPLHNLKPGTSYPATMVTTGDHDDRVVPAHSFKFAATLQADNAGPNPTLIRIDTQAGHGAGKPTGKLIEESADIWSFIMYNLGMHFKN